MPFDYSDWQTTQSNLADALQRRRFEAQMQDPRLQEMELVNRLRRMALTQGEESFPTNLGIAKENLATSAFNRQQAQERAPLESFLQNVAGLGPNAGANASLAQNPAWAQKTFGPSSVPMQGAMGTLPEVAQKAGQNFYNWGPEMARQLNMMGESLPITQELLGVKHGYDTDLERLRGSSQIQAAQAGRAAHSDEQSLNRQQAATGAAVQMFVDPKLPWRQQLSLVQNGVGMVKTQEQARTMMETINSIVPQMDSTYNSSMSINRAMRGDPATEQSLVAEMIKVYAQLKQASDALRARWFAPTAQAAPGQSSFPDTSGGYSP